MIVILALEHGNGNLTRCYTTIVYKEADKALLPVYTDDKARKVIENTFLSVNLTDQYENYEIVSYEKQKNPGPPYNIIIPGDVSVEFKVLDNGIVEWTMCGRKIGNMRKCSFKMNYKETDPTLLPVDTEDKAHKVIENAFSSFDLTEKYKGNYEIKHYPYDINVHFGDDRFRVLNDGTVERTMCAR